MECICLKDQLQKSLQLAEHYTNRTATIPILQGILLETDKNALVIRSTNLDTGFETTISAQVKKEGSAVLPAKPSVSLISSLSGEKIRIESQENTIHLITENTTTMIKGYPREDFPKLPRMRNGQQVVFKKNDLLKNLKSVWFSASLSDLKPEIASVLFRSKSGQPLKVVATDSFRLSERIFEKSYKEVFSFLFPSRRVLEFIKILESFDGELEFVFDKQQLFVSHPSFSYFTRLTDGNFPDYEQIIPTSFVTEVTVNRNKFLKNLKLAGIFAGRLKEVHLQVYPSDHLLEITTSDSEVGEHVSQLSVQATGESIKMSFNQRYVLDGLEPIESEDVILRFSGVGRPLLIQNPQDLSYTYLVMPMKNT